MNNKIFQAIGLISGTSMDGIDITLVETDGITLKRLNLGFTHSYSFETKNMLEKAILDPWKLNNNKLNFDTLTKQITEDHLITVELLKKRISLKPNLIGFHGQTILHIPEKKISIQLGDSHLLAKKTNVKVVSDFRSNDLFHGGQGAPLAPIYHMAMLKSMNIKLPSCIINIGGVSNLTYYDGANLIGFDTGPGNGLMDWYMYKKTNLPFDEKGYISKKGSPNYDIVNKIITNVFFRKQPPKSIDRFYFKQQLIDLQLFDLSTEDAMSTIAEITIVSILNALKIFTKNINLVMVIGGGQYNEYLLEELQKRTLIKIKTGNSLGIPGDLIEAELIAYLAARHMNNLPITFPQTTGAPEPLLGGVLSIPNN
jgi:anhydro-N-acetylmuramic acid kinase